jgi:hypothetical protein
VRILSRIVTGVLLVLALLLAFLWPTYTFAPAIEPPFVVQRLPDNPIVSAVAAEQGYHNVNGPSVIRVPPWISNPLGKYYLYFAHHKGSYIRLAYADHPAGPWKIHTPGALQIADSHFPSQLDSAAGGGGGLASLWKNYPVRIARDLLLLLYDSAVAGPAARRERGIDAAQNKQPHIASPEVVIDEDQRRLVMYFHGMESHGGQRSRIAVSSDGLHFQALDLPVSSTYLRHFSHAGKHYLLGMPGIVLRGESLEGPFEMRSSLLFEPGMRHAGLWLEGDQLQVFWSRVGDAPESILWSSVDLSADDWNDWAATAPVVILQPELPWEGSDLDLYPSLRGELDLATRELRDPYVFRDSDGQLYLYYTGSGEQSIGVAQLIARE